MEFSFAKLEKSQKIQYLFEISFHFFKTSIGEFRPKKRYTNEIGHK